jgi:hypothetical protein
MIFSGLKFTHQREDFPHYFTQTLEQINVKSCCDDFSELSNFIMEKCLIKDTSIPSFNHSIKRSPQKILYDKEEKDLIKSGLFSQENIEVILIQSIIQLIYEDFMFNLGKYKSSEHDMAFSIHSILISTFSQKLFETSSIVSDVLQNGYGVRNGQVSSLIPVLMHSQMSLITYHTTIKNTIKEKILCTSPEFDREFFSEYMGDDARGLIINDMLADISTLEIVESVLDYNSFNIQNIENITNIYKDYKADRQKKIDQLVSDTFSDYYLSDSYSSDYDGDSDCSIYSSEDEKYKGAYVFPPYPELLKNLPSITEDQLSHK